MNKFKTLRAQTLGYAAITITTSPLPLGNYKFYNDSGMVGYYALDNLGYHWYDYWSNYVFSSLIAGVLNLSNYESSILNFLPELPTDLGFASYLPPNRIFTLAHTNTLIKYIIKYYVDRDTDIFSDTLEGAHTVYISKGDCFRVDGKLSIGLTPSTHDYNDYIAIKPDFTGQIPFILSQLKQEVSLTISHLVNNKENEIYSITGSDGEIIKDSFNVDKNEMYIIHFEKPASINVSTATYTLRFGL